MKKTRKSNQGFGETLRSKKMGFVNTREEKIKVAMENSEREVLISEFESVYPIEVLEEMADNPNSIHYY